MYKLIKDTIDRMGGYYPEETKTIGVYDDLASVAEAMAKDYNESYDDYDDLDDEAEEHGWIDPELQFHYDNVWIFIDPGWIFIYHAENTSEGA